MKIASLCALLFLSATSLCAQQPADAERRVALSEKAVALNGSDAPTLEATLKTTALNGSQDSPVTNISLVVRNASGDA